MSLAASVSVSLPASVRVGEVFEVFINVDSGGTLINSAEITLDYDENLMSFSGYKDDGAVMGLWIDSPREKNGEIHMSGIIPGGVLGLYDPEKQGLEAIPLTRLLFTAEKDGRAIFSFSQTKILKHDGRGTQLAHTEQGGTVVIKNSDPDTLIKVVDTTKPEPFQLTFLESAFFGRTPSMIIFKTNDIGSGIKEYQMSISGGSWKEAKNPQPVFKGIFPRTIIIRAFDFYGNFQDSTLRIPGLLSPKLLWIIFMLLIFCFGSYKVLKYKA
ncbi:MAG: cohesin domain-containing protein [Patescibacteria group bacterium]